MFKEIGQSHQIEKLVNTTINKNKWLARISDVRVKICKMSSWDIFS